MPWGEKLSRVDLEARLRVIHEKTPKAGQLLAIDTLFNEETDVILIAKTGYGKSMVFHSVSALEEDTMTLMIMPLLALEDQKASIKRMQANINPCILNGETMTKDLLERDSVWGLYSCSHVSRDSYIQPRISTGPAAPKHTAATGSCRHR